MKEGKGEMTKIKFDKCFTGNKKVSIEDMVTSNGRLRRESDPDALYCPVCKKARLKFTSATSQRVAYLSTWPDAIHLANCSYGVQMASKTETKTYFKELTEDRVKDKLIACVRWMSPMRHQILLLLTLRRMTHIRGEVYYGKASALQGKIRMII